MIRTVAVWPKQPKAQEKRFAAVVFDLFGTLVYLSKDTKMLNRLFERLQLAPEECMPARLIAMTNEFDSIADLAQRLKPGTDIDCADFEEMAQEDTENFCRYPESKDVLNKLIKKNVQLGIISNLTSMYKKAPCLRNFFQCFDHTIVSCEAGMYKPNPAIYRLMIGKMAEKAEIEPGQIIMIGDQRKKDCDAPRAAGMHGIHLDRTGLSLDSVNSLSAILKYF